MRDRRQSGFTLVELMITMVVLVVLVTLALPSFRDLIDKSRLRGATDDIVNLLNMARASAVKLQRDVNVSINSSGWCAGAVAAGDPADVGEPVPSATACDCTASTVACLVGGQNSLVSSTNYSGATISGVNSAIAYGTGAAGEGITFNSKAGALDLGSLPTGALVTVTSPNGKYQTQITVSPLGQTYVCVPNSKFVSGYPSC
jgi:type IV fimbrial biogenesis protein FimT